MKKRIIALALAASFTTFTSCDDRLEDLNTDKINPAQVSAASLFTNGVKEGFDRMGSIDVNNNPFRLFAQYWAQTTYPEESQYNLTTRNIPANFWNSGYRDVLIDLKESKRLLEENIKTEPTSEEVLKNKIACTEIMSVYTYSTLVDAFGNIPYTESLDITNFSPKYDDGRTIYSELVTRLDAAIALTNTGKVGFSAAQDAVFHGDMSQWVKFANSLKLRIGMRLADVDKSASISIVNGALAGVLESNADNVTMQYESASPNTSRVYNDLVLSQRNDFVTANTFADYLNSIQDPRIATLAQPYALPFPGGADYTLPMAMYVVYDDGTVYLPAGSVVKASDKSRNPKIFVGGVYGNGNTFLNYSRVSKKLYDDPTYGATAINYAEVEFLMAEAAARGGYAVTGTAAEHYNAGIRASFEEFGVEGADAYIAQPKVNYATAEGDFKTKIGRQMWVALYNEGFEAWTTWRRLDFGLMRPLPSTVPSPIDLPVRLIYPSVEAQLNGTQYAAAGAAIGGDETTTKIFWDVE